jgi:translation initiation factor 2 subunit 1
VALQEEQEDYPAVGDLVVATVQRLVGYGSYVSLDEYPGKEGLIHISEISTRWVRNIKNHLREGQKLTLKVLRVDSSRGQIDLSLRRVTGRQKIEKMLEWKRDKKAESILKGAQERLGDKIDLERVKEQILSKYSSLYEAFEVAIDEGEESLEQLDLPKEWSKILYELAKTKIKLEKAKLKATLELVCSKQDGIEAIRKSLKKAKEIKKPRRAQIRAYTLGAPKYEIEITAGDYQETERLLDESVDKALSTIKSYNGVGKRI